MTWRTRRADRAVGFRCAATKAEEVSVTETTYVNGLEFDMAGQIAKVHAIACYDGMPWPATACGLPNQAYPSTRAEWDTVRAEVRCARCADALGTPDPENAR
jgi:hypothetical protein